MSSSKLNRLGTSRTKALLATPLIALALIVAACTPTTPGGETTTTSTTSSTTTSSTTIPEPVDPTVTGEACQPGVGVTVVVDFTALDNSVKIGCADGAPANGFAALTATGFITTDESGPGTVCTIDGLPTEGFPYCWLEGGYWSYWKSPNRDTAWDFSQVGGGNGPLVQGSVEGWSWAPAFNGVAPRVSVADLADHTPEPPACEVPDAPVLSIIAATETLTFTIAGGAPVEVAVIAADADPSTAVYTTTNSLALADHVGTSIRVLARSVELGCAVQDTFDATYEVQATNPGRKIVNPGANQVVNPLNPAIPTASASILGWATGHSNYTPGTDVAANWQVPTNAYGSAASGLLPLGNGGSVTLTFDNPITDGGGYDFAVWENGFYQNNTSENLFAEYGYVEVSSNGSDFVRFDSSSTWQTPVGAFGYINSAHIGALAGRDGSGFGTPFDLTTLKNKTAVRNGTVDLAAITHVRIVDVVGGAAWPNAGDNHIDPDSWGRAIIDNFRTTGSGGFDLTGVGVLNQAAPAA